MQDMKILWEIGVQMLDKYHKESFTLRAIIFVTINDHPALFLLSGQFKGKLGCVVCIDDTAYVSLTASKKIVYRGTDDSYQKDTGTGRKRWISTLTIIVNYGLLLDQVTVKAKEFSA